MRLRLYKFPPMCEDYTTGNPQVSRTVLLRL
ncbi:hypothetical protein CGCSCA4_v000954 [Colletotrichum siamense]|uniref:Uncharacterized protein n=1 Tax=Colletotrichum siamense TaxID=690259 RepID=A0A9P5F595_COLSI|nr:hypothetical protein CGCSCA4_v000954 [Colletotrichum siamense]KAF4866278.1 hypothetical protein CGCSCA2_v001057 [Colletotrichum siamense]